MADGDPIEGYSSEPVRELPNTPVREYISHHVDRMRAVRRDNNDLWMAVLDIALKHAPGPTKELVRQIRKNDMRIAELFDEIAGC